MSEGRITSPSGILSLEKGGVLLMGMGFGMGYELMDTLFPFLFLLFFLAFFGTLI